MLAGPVPWDMKEKGASLSPPPLSRSAFKMARGDTILNAGMALRLGYALSAMQHIINVALE